jgi:orotidine-5'-phosphate decarboxylase
MEAEERIIVALDVPTEEEAFTLVSRLRGRVGMFKVGSELFTAAGPELVRKMIFSGEKVFLDLKFHDIPNTVAKAGIAAAALGVSLFNLHASGGREMLARTASDVREYCQKNGLIPPRILAVTLLTSLTKEEAKEVGFGSDVLGLVKRLSLLSREAGLDGVVCSPREIEVVRKACGKGFLIVTPGIRPRFAQVNDQKRITTPKEALSAGADYLVIGRPITKAPSPEKAVERILSEIG